MVDGASMAGYDADMDLLDIGALVDASAGGEPTVSPQATAPEAAGICVRTHARAPSFELRPRAGAAQWLTVAAKFLPRSVEVFCSGRCLRTRPPMFGIYVASLMASKAQFVEAVATLVYAYRRYV